MHINFLAYNYRNYDGYGRYAQQMIKALRVAGVDVAVSFCEAANASPWLQREFGLDWDNLTISLTPPPYLNRVPGEHWLYTMTEGSEAPPGWVDMIHASGVSRVIVPCRHNARAFQMGGLTVPISVVPGGINPKDWQNVSRETFEPYTFLTLADRGARKGWIEVWQAFYQEFGSWEQTPDVQLIIKSRPGVNNVLELIAKSERTDPRIIIQTDDAPNMMPVYAQANCVVLPSRSEGWGMPHREAAACGIPVIVQKYAGLDDGNTENWAITLTEGRMEPIPATFEHIAGEWMIANIDELAGAMRRCYEYSGMAAQSGQSARGWLHANQTWKHSATALINLIEATYGSD